MKKILSIILMLTINNYVNSQNLSIKETINYLNDILQEHPKKNYEKKLIHQTIYLKTDGQLVFNDYHPNFVFEMNIIDTNLKWLKTNTDSQGRSYAQISFENHAIKSILLKDNNIERIRNETWTNIYIENIDSHTCRKFTNALNYLISIVKNSEEYASIDEDPFSPKNYNPNAFEISSIAKNGKVKLSKDSGIYHISISIGGMKENFILDSGASEVLISKTLERKLISNGFLKKENYLPDGLYRIADGTIIKQRRLLIPKLVIGNFTLSNVNASVSESEILLLGKSVLDKFKSWKINNLSKELELEK